MRLRQLGTRIIIALYHRRGLRVVGGELTQMLRVVGGELTQMLRVVGGELTQMLLAPPRASRSDVAPLATRKALFAAERARRLMMISQTTGTLG